MNLSSLAATVSHTVSARRCPIGDYSNKSDYQELLSDYVESSTDEGISKLAEYVAHRKTIIDLLEKIFRYQRKIYQELLYYFDKQCLLRRPV